jgi:hypothetical protein
MEADEPQSADSHGITGMCMVWLTEDTWAKLGVKDWESKGSVPCVVEGEFVQLYTGQGMIQVRRSRGNVIARCQPIL